MVLTFNPNLQFLLSLTLSLKLLNQSLDFLWAGAVLYLYTFDFTPQRMLRLMIRY